MKRIIPVNGPLQWDFILQAFSESMSRKGEKGVDQSKEYSRH